ncbi:uncharacterized protein si:dkey-282h22.5 [Antennarius striatus]|uniref:uncharacterized protein si:dkey-282h22.5 n=1 Tax=Antennarius striatus TaxID=241820 RepID=UPI0035B173C2
MRTKEILALLCMTITCCAQKRKKDSSCWDSKEHSNGKTCANLTQVLDNWKFAIVTQVKDLLVYDHASVLPEYNRIEPLSNALGDLHRQFKSLKEDLGKLTSKFDTVEAFVDDLKEGRFSLHHRALQRSPPSIGLRSPLRVQMRASHLPLIKESTLTRNWRTRPRTP